MTTTATKTWLTTRKRWAHNHEPKTGSGAQDLRKYQSCPGQTEIDAQTVPDLWSRCRKNKVTNPLVKRCFHCSRNVEIVFRHIGDCIRDHQHQLEKHTQRDDHDLSPLAASEPQDHQRDDGRHWHKADERDWRNHQPRCNGVPRNQDTHRKSNSGCQKKPGDDFEKQRCRDRTRMLRTLTI